MQRGSFILEKAISTDVMSVSELTGVLSWAAGEGWNPGLSDATAFYAADPKGFFLTKVHETPVAAISVVNHDDLNAFLGLYICHPDWRGQGLGLATWNFGIAHAGTRSIGLDGVPDQEHNYRTSGFVKTGSSMRHEGRLDGKQSQNVRLPSVDDIKALVQLDASANGYARQTFLRSWLWNDEQTRGTRVLVRDGDIVGFATWRACESGTKIGPVVAPDVAAALELISDIATFRRDGPLIVDVPEGNADLRKQLESWGFTVPFVTARMYRGTPPEAGPSLQAIATMELG